MPDGGATAARARSLCHDHDLARRHPPAPTRAPRPRRVPASPRPRRAARDPHLVGLPRRRARLQGQEARPLPVPRLRHARTPARAVRRGAAARPPLRAERVRAASSRSCRAGPTACGVALEPDPRALEYAVEMRRYDERRHARRAARLARARPTWWPSAARSPASTPAPRRGAGGRRSHAVVDETLDHARRRRRAAGAARRRSRASAAPRWTASGRSSRAAPPRAACATATATCAPSTCCWASGSRRSIALEFDRELRVADVAYDLAFLVMDVARRDDELARALVRGYRAGGGDPGSDESARVPVRGPRARARQGRPPARRQLTGARRRRARARAAWSCSRWPSGSPGVSRLPGSSA